MQTRTGCTFVSLSSMNITTYELNVELYTHRGGQVWPRIHHYKGADDTKKMFISGVSQGRLSSMALVNANIIRELPRRRGF